MSPQLPAELWAMIFCIRTDMILNSKGYRNWCLTQKRETWTGIHQKLMSMGLYVQDILKERFYFESPPSRQTYDYGRYQTWSRTTWAMYIWGPSIRTYAHVYDNQWDLNAYGWCVNGILWIKTKKHTNWKLV